MKRVSVVALLKAKPGQEERVRSELLDLVSETRKETGCLNYDLHESMDDPGTFVFYENWVSRMALANHFDTPHINRLKSLEGELLQSPAQITIMKMVSEPE